MIIGHLLHVRPLKRHSIVLFHLISITFLLSTILFAKEEMVVSDRLLCVQGTQLIFSQSVSEVLVLTLKRELSS